jgi:hypothetical protein
VLDALTRVGKVLPAGRQRVGIERQLLADRDPSCSIHFTYVLHFSYSCSPTYAMRSTVRSLSPLLRMGLESKDVLTFPKADIRVNQLRDMIVSVDQKVFVDVGVELEESDIVLVMPPNEARIAF